MCSAAESNREWVTTPKNHPCHNAEQTYCQFFLLVVIVPKFPAVTVLKVVRVNIISKWIEIAGEGLGRAVWEGIGALQLRTRTYSVQKVCGGI